MCCQMSDETLDEEAYSDDSGSVLPSKDELIDSDMMSVVSESTSSGVLVSDSLSGDGDIEMDIPSLDAFAGRG